MYRLKQVLGAGLLGLGAGLLLSFLFGNVITALVAIAALAGGFFLFTKC